MVLVLLINALLQEDNKCLDKMHRQKVAEVEKLSTTVDELQEAVAAGGTAAHVNAAIRDYQRQVQELSVSPTVRQQLCILETHPPTAFFSLFHRVSDKSHAHVQLKEAEKIYYMCVRTTAKKCADLICSGCTLQAALWVVILSIRIQPRDQ